MPRLLNKSAIFASLLLLALIGSVSLFETPSGAAEPPQTHPLSFAENRNSNPHTNSPRPANFSDNGDVHIVVTTSQGLSVSRRIISRAANPDAITSEANSSLSAAPMRPAAAGDIVFSQIYASGGNPGSTFQNNYLELFNRTNHTIDINSWRFYITDANGTFNTSLSIISSQGIAIGAGRYLLIQFGPASSNGRAIT